MRGTDCDCSRPNAGEGARSFALGVWSVLATIATALLSRRLNGAFISPDGHGLVCGAATFATLISFSAYAAWSAVSQRGARLGAEILASAATLVPPAVIGLALWINPSPFVRAFLASTTAASILGILVIRNLRSTERSPAGVVIEAVRNSGIACALGHDSETAKIVPFDKEDSEETIGEQEDPSTVQQWMTRRGEPGGMESVEGGVRVCFDDGATIAWAHVPFLPPLSNRPRVDCHVVSDFPGRARVAAAHSYGLRIELRRSEPGPSIRVEVAFTARTDGTEAAA